MRSMPGCTTERVTSGGSGGHAQRRFEAPFETLPDGTFVVRRRGRVPRARRRGYCGGRRPATTWLARGRTAERRCSPHRRSWRCCDAVGTGSCRCCTPRRNGAGSNPGDNPGDDPGDRLKPHACQRAEALRSQPLPHAGEQARARTCRSGASPTSGRSSSRRAHGSRSGSRRP